LKCRSYFWLFLILDLCYFRHYRPLQRSKRRWVLTTLELQEEDPGPFPKLVGELFNNMSNNMSLMYLISGPGVDEFPEIGLFSIEDNESGKIYVHRPIDRETTPSFMVHIDAMDRSAGKLVDESLIFHIKISDVNDHAPQFPEEEFNLTVKETHPAGQPIFQMLTVDLDQENTPNSQVLYFLVSQTPSLKESGFRIDLMSGEIRLSGCLDYETAPRYTLLIRARDCGEPALSATAAVHISVEEGNTHMPTFPQDRYKIQLSEGQVYQGVLHFPVQDHDSPFTSAWRAEFSILYGNEEGHFDVVTDPETNQGILSVVKCLDYETQAAHSLVISVENQEPLFSCEEGQLQPSRQALASATVSVLVVDINDPPTFHRGSFIVSKEDGARPGIQLGAFSATDPDGAADQIRYKLVHDPANWVTVDENSGVVTTRRQIDRESPHVNDSFYTIIVQAVDNGLPPRTGTGTLLLFLSDINDNAPALRSHSRYLEVCESARSQPLLLEAEDADLEPYAEPFSFELDTSWGDVADTWTLGARQDEGRSAELLMLRSLPPGNYFIPVVIGDRQGFSQKQVVHVRICSCPGGLKCEEHMHTGLLWWALSPVCAALMTLAAALLSLLRCYFELGLRRHRSFTPSDNGHQTLIVYKHESKAQVDLESTWPRCPPQPREGRMVETWHQRFHNVDVWKGDADHLPRVYSEEGECEGTETLSSLTFSEQELFKELLECWGPRAAPAEAPSSVSGVAS
uniref:Cadherin-like protein 26 n=1 Tax=Jaculus jaculus TaxID=51337 RepID=A0A8C5K4K5_JACJA